MDIKRYELWTNRRGKVELRVTKGGVSDEKLLVFYNDHIADREADKQTITELEVEVARLREDSRRYQWVKTASRHELLLWRGMFGCADDAIDELLTQEGGE